MARDEIAALTRSKLEEGGYRGTVLRTENVTQLKSEIEEGISQGRIAARVYDRYLAGFQFDVTARFPGARSIIVTAAPQPQRKVTFRFNQRTYSTIIPPTYYNDTDEQIRNILQTVLTSSGYHLYQAALPLKLLAARSGMTRYGKNNIAYVEGLGSFIRLRAFLSDIPADSSDWFEPRAMTECDNCKACLKACPTGAIVSDRFLIHAERCITFFNEEPGEFPEWIDPAAHNSLVGCMRCQVVCPVNKQFAKWVEEGENFTESDTKLILNKVSLDHMPPATVRKLNHCYILEYLGVLPRNLRALLK